MSGDERSPRRELTARGLSRRRRTRGLRIEVALSVTEGEDKPFELSAMFLRTDHVAVGAIRDALAHVMPKPHLISVSGEGIADWLAWLEARRLARLASSAASIR